MAVRIATPETPPMREMNMTPLIDVMLVLLVMFILTIPLQTHAVKLDLPGGNPPPNRVERTRNEIRITRGGVLLWNGAPVGFDALRADLAAAAALDPQPELHLVPDADARYALVDRVLAETKRAHVEHLGFVGNERYRDF